MIQLHTNYLVFKTPSGRYPCSAFGVAAELLGKSIKFLPPNLFQQIVTAVVNHFRKELGKIEVTLEEFVEVLAGVIRSFGYQVVVEQVVPQSNNQENLPSNDRNVVDLVELYEEAWSGGELTFFSRLKEELNSRLNSSEQILEIRGLRPCVKKMASRKRWCPTCRKLEIQIVTFLQEQFIKSHPSASRILLIR